MISIGVIIMVLGFLGCCGAYRENRCLLLLFFILLFLIFVLLLAAGILAAVEGDKVKGFVEEKLKGLTPISNQPQNVIEDMEKLQREVYNFTTLCKPRLPSDYFIHSCFYTYIYHGNF
ncbi:hypothetical protein AMECASPLE_028285 [Ameca splendens]|uniref:Tetraspanin n=1 Tax=Ameca splendens TaxID=208324 RepID=A0ABV0Z3C7_9TELE